MQKNQTLIYDTKRLLMIRYPMFGSEIAGANIEYKTDLKYHTAATDGKNIFFDPDYLASLSDDDRLFLVAHELMHIKFEHMYRLKTKDGKKRNAEVWNEATDAIINANLERDGFTIKEGYVNRPDALNYSAEEYYQLLLKEKEEQQQQKQNGQGGEGEGQGGEGEGQNSESNEGQSEQSQEEQGSNGQGQGGQKQMTDDHSLWEEAFEESENTQGKQSQKDQKQKTTEAEEESRPSSDVDEKDAFDENRKVRRAKAREIMEKMTNSGLQESSEKIEFGNVGEAKPIIDWKLLLRREVEKTETIWSQRKSIAENNYAYRLEENDIEDQAETEVMIDVSGSVSIEMVKCFLRQLKPLLKESRLKVGCFNEQFWGMININSNKDIDNFSIPKNAYGQSAWTEDWDLAVRSFSKKREINKIVFTDGNPCPGTMPKNDLKGTNVIWLVYDNKNFNPCCGKVIMVDEKQLNATNMVTSKSPELSM